MPPRHFAAAKAASDRWLPPQPHGFEAWRGEPLTAVRTQDRQVGGRAPGPCKRGFR
jgi:hypothetical protein